MKKFFCCLLFIIMFSIPSVALAETKFTDECEYTLSYPVYYCLQSGYPKDCDAINGGYKFYLDNCKNSPYGEAECLKRAGIDMEIATIKIRINNGYNSFKACLDAKECDILYKSSKQNVNGEKEYVSFAYQYVNDYDANMTCLNCQKQKLGVDYSSMETWYDLMQKDKKCPDVFVRGNKDSNNFSVIDILYAPTECFKNATDYNNGKINVCDKNIDYVKLIKVSVQRTLNNGELENVEDLPVEDNPLADCEYTNFIGLGPLASANINLKIAYQAWELQSNHEILRTNLTFSAGDKQTLFENAGETQTFDINFPVNGLGNNFKIYIANTVLDSYSTQSNMFGGISCLDGDKEFYVYPKETKDGITTYEITDDTIKKAEYEASLQSQNSQSKYVGDFKFCEEDGILKTFQIVGYLIILIKVLIPLLLIIFGSIDFGKAMIASDDKAINKAAQMLVIRAAAGVIIFFIPTIIKFAIGLVSSWSSVESEFTNCSTCILDISKCNTTRQDVCEKVKNGSKIKETDDTETVYSCDWTDGNCNCTEVTNDK